MITIQNINRKWDEIKEKLSPEIVEIGTNNGFLETAESYEDLEEFLDDEAKEMLNKFIERVNEELKSSESKSDNEDEEKNTKKTTSQKTKTKKKPRQKFKVGDSVTTDHSDDVYVVTEASYNGHAWHYTLDHISGEWSEEQLAKAKSTKKEFDGELVPAFPVEISYLKRYLALNGNTVKQALCKKTNNPLSLLNSLQKSIVEKKIRKTSDYADEIMSMQKNLIKIIDAKDKSATIEIVNSDSLQKIVKGYAVSECAKIVKFYISKIQGKDDKKREAKNLLKRIEAADFAGCTFDKQIKEMKKSLTDYIDDKTDVCQLSEQTLNGLYGLAGLDGCSIKSGKALGSTDFIQKHFSPMNFTGKWKSLIGNPSHPYKMMIYGKAGGGKSTLALQYAKYLSEKHNQKVLYVAHEEGFSYTLKDKLQRTGAANDNLDVIDTLPKDLSQYDVIFIDSVNSTYLDAEHLRNIGKGKTFVYVFQTTKDGNFRGENTYIHDVDVVIRVDDKKASAEKNRFGGSGVIDIF